jgi:hypothetical protein
MKLCHAALIAGLWVTGCSKPAPPVDYAERNRVLVAQGAIAKAERLTERSLAAKEPLSGNMIQKIREGGDGDLCPESAAAKHASGADDEFARRAREEATLVAGDKCVQRLEAERSGRWPAGALFVWSEGAESGGDYSFDRQTIPVQVGHSRGLGFGFSGPSAAYLGGGLAFMPGPMLALSGGTHPSVTGGGTGISLSLAVPEAQAKETKAAMFGDRAPPLFFEVAFEATGYGVTGVTSGPFGAQTDGFRGRAIAFRLVGIPGAGTEHEFLGWTPFTQPPAPPG